jgi:hypothetical protein
LRPSAASVALLVGPLRCVELLELGPELVVDPLLLPEKREELPQLDPPPLLVVVVFVDEPPEEPHDEPEDERLLPPLLLLLRLLLLEDELRPPPKLPPLAPRAQSSLGRTMTRATNRQTRRNKAFIGFRRWKSASELRGDDLRKQQRHRDEQGGRNQTRRRVLVH